MTTAETRYISTTETAAIIRRTLKPRFPGVKFSVRSHSYAGGSSINVHWDDGPRAKDVDAVLAGFEGKGFDGMIDLAYRNESWLMPDGSARFAATDGTLGNMGTVPGYVSDAPHPDAELVRFSSDYVFSNRHITAFDAQEAEALAFIRQHCRTEDDEPMDRFGNQWVSNLARGMVFDRVEGEDWQPAFNYIICREERR